MSDAERFALAVDGEEPLASSRIGGLHDEGVHQNFDLNVGVLVRVELGMNSLRKGSVHLAAEQVDHPGVRGDVFLDRLAEEIRHVGGEWSVPASAGMLDHPDALLVDENLDSSLLKGMGQLDNLAPKVIIFGHTQEGVILPP